ncbi:MAG: hypothetical protein ACFFAY_14215 [Promethearchaeota archaeon]
MQVFSTTVSVIVVASIAFLTILTIIQYRRLRKLYEEVVSVTQLVENDELERSEQ